MNKDRREGIERVVEHIITNYNYGDTITYKQLERVMGIDAEELEFSYNMIAIKNELILYGCVLTSVVNEGYRILNPNEIAGEVHKKYGMASLNKLKKGLLIMEHTDQGQLNEEEKEQFLGLQSILGSLVKSNEDNLLKAQYIIGETKRKELKEASK